MSKHRASHRASGKPSSPSAPGGRRRRRAVPEPKTAAAPAAPEVSEAPAAPEPEPAQPEPAQPSPPVDVVPDVHPLDFPQGAKAKTPRASRRSRRRREQIEKDRKVFGVRRTSTTTAKRGMSAAQRRNALVAVAAVTTSVAVVTTGVWLSTGNQDAASADPVTEATSSALVRADDLAAPVRVRAPEVISAAFASASGTLRDAPQDVDAIPMEALSAYQRAETVINKAAKDCDVDWMLLAAVGRVESNHGTTGGGDLTEKGVATPEVFGRTLDGLGDRPKVKDSDGGSVDDDDQWDRSVGPMQILPSTWSVIGLDGDGDGARNPQDIDDSALAAAVYLCAEDRVLSDPKVAAKALGRYNAAEGYADAVLTVARHYRRDAAADPVVVDPTAPLPTYPTSPSESPSDLPSNPDPTEPDQTPQPPRPTKPPKPTRPPTTQPTKPPKPTDPTPTPSSSPS